MYVSDLMTSWSRLRWKLWRATSRVLPSVVGRSFLAHFRDGMWLHFRLDTFDVSTAHEVWLNREYDREWMPPEVEGSVIDLGGNVGFAAVHFARRWPHCRVLTVEPIPEHVVQIRRNVAANGLGSRVEIIEGAAGVALGEVSMIPDGICSRRGEGGAGEISVPVIDVYEAMASRQPVGLLKMDIEGAEFEILGDPRLAEIDIRMIALEWHTYGDVSDPQFFVEARLEAAGFEIVERMQNPPHGLIYARRSGTASSAGALGGC